MNPWKVISFYLTIVLQGWWVLTPSKTSKKKKHHTSHTTGQEVTQLQKGGAKTWNGSKVYIPSTALNASLWKDAKSMYITLFLHLLEWNWKIPNLVPRPWSGPRVPFHLTFNHYPHCPLSNSTDLPATHQKQKQTKHAPSSKPSHLLFSLPKCCSSDLHASWSFSPSKSQVLPPLRPSMTTLPKTAHSIPSCYFYHSIYHYLHISV